MDSLIEIVIFLLLIFGGTIADAVKKKKAKRAEEELEQALEQAKPPAASNTYRSDGAAVKTPPQKKAAAKKPAKKSAVRPEDSEWLQTLADQKRRDELKAAERTQAFEDTLINGQSESSPAYLQSTAAFTLSVQQARDGIVLAEILGPPVSLR
ncbi:hypothetical protein R80B4_00849 [Fibrobacteres bacterium R8-0-B4]